MAIVSKQVGPFMGVQFDKVKKFGNKRSFRIVAYQAYNACGLIGSECNGVAILDEDKKAVVCDEIDKQDTGYYGLSEHQLKTAETIASMDWEQFRIFVNSNPRLRCSI